MIVIVRLGRSQGKEWGVKQNQLDWIANVEVALHG